MVWFSFFLILFSARNNKLCVCFFGKKCNMNGGIIRNYHNDNCTKWCGVLAGLDLLGSYYLGSYVMYVCMFKQGSL